MKEDCDSIMVTLSRNTIKNRKGGFKEIVQEWLEMDGIHYTWYYKLSSGPKDPSRISWVYWVIGNRVRYRSRVLEVERKKAMIFSHDQKPIFARAWLVCFDFEAIPRRSQVYFKGFQGFRYINHLELGKYKTTMGTVAQSDDATD